MKAAPSPLTRRTTISRWHRADEPLVRAPASPPQGRALPRTALIDALKTRIRAIERSPDGIVVPPDLPSLRHGTQLRADPADGRDAPKVSLSPLELSRPSPLAGTTAALAAGSAEGWCLGAPEIDALLPDFQLDSSALHEAKPASVRDWGTTFGFILRLAHRRLAASPGTLQRAPLMVWCWPSRMAREHGHLCTAGLAALGIDPKTFLVVETAKADDALWVLEESLRSGAAALVAGVLDAVASTPARRLSLAAAAKRTPAFLLTGPATPGTAALATRWQIAAAPSAPHATDPRAPGAARFHLMLTRCRGSVRPLADRPTLVEWSDDASCFRVVPALVPATAETRAERQPWRRRAG